MTQVVTCPEQRLSEQFHPPQELRSRLFDDQSQGSSTPQRSEFDLVSSQVRQTNSISSMETRFSEMLQNLVKRCQKTVW